MNNISSINRYLTSPFMKKWPKWCQMSFSGKKVAIFDQKLWDEPTNDISIWTVWKTYSGKHRFKLLKWQKLFKMPFSGQITNFDEKKRAPELISIFHLCKYMASKYSGKISRSDGQKKSTRSLFKGSVTIVPPVLPLLYLGWTVKNGVYNLYSLHF